MIARRSLLPLAGAALAATAARAEPRRFEAIAFDGFAIIDPRPVAARAEALFPGRGAALMEAWRARQFEYTWLRTLMGRYIDFPAVTREALVAAARATGTALSDDNREKLMQAFGELKAWPDVAPALRTLKGRGLRLAFLANPPDRMFDSVVAASGLDGLLEPHLSTDRVGVYKPHPLAYHMALDAFGLARGQILFVASAAWDAAGAKAFGYPTFWLNRASLPAEELGVVPDAVGTNMAELVAFAGA